MKSFLTKLVAIFSLVVFSFACSKDDTTASTPIPTITYQIQGLYSGKYGNGTATPSSGYSMVVEDGGKVTVADGATLTGSSLATGTYTLVNNVFKATYTYSGGSTFSIQANYSPITGKLSSGTWGSGSSFTGSGTWFMDRKN